MLEVTPLSSSTDLFTSAFTAENDPFKLADADYHYISGIPCSVMSSGASTPLSETDCDASEYFSFVQSPIAASVPDFGIHPTIAVPLNGLTHRRSPTSTSTAEREGVPSDLALTQAILPTMALFPVDNAADFNNPMAFPGLSVYLEPQPDAYPQGASSDEAPQSIQERRIHRRRERNRISARRSREKRLVRMKNLTEQTEDLRRENHTLRLTLRNAHAELQLLRTRLGLPAWNLPSNDVMHNNGFLILPNGGETDVPTPLRLE